MLRDDDIRSIGFESGLLHINGTTFTRWKDGIDIDFPVLAVEKFARAVEQAAYERAAAHVRALKRDRWYLRVAPEIVIDECALAIEKLMT